MSDEREALRTWLDLLGKTNAIKKEIDTMLRKEFRMSIARFDVLAALSRAGKEGLRAGALTQRLKVTDGNTTQVTTPLIHDGFVKRVKNSSDGRVAIFQITKKGETLFEKMAKRNKDCVAKAFNYLSQTQMRSLRTFLDKLSPDGITATKEKTAA